MKLHVAAAAAVLALAAASSEAAAQYDPYRPAYPVYQQPGRSYVVPDPSDDDDEVAPPAPSYRRGDVRSEPLPGVYERRFEERAERGPYDRRYDERLERAPAPLYDSQRPAPYPQPQQGRVMPGPYDPPDAGPLPRPPAAVGAPTAIAPNAAPRPTGPGQYASLPPDDQPETGAPKELPPQFKRQLVSYNSKEPAGTILIDTANTYLYLLLGNGQAVRYGIGVGRDGFTWAGREKISRMAEWPDWHPPADMIERQPYLPRFMAGGDGNPLGARALYLGKTLYRIHGTNQPSTIGQFVSSGCIRMLNEDIEDLYQRVQVGTHVVVLPGKPPATAQR
jgi:lipoprotein-anchoring transpeptidase ErfK/SrfK